MTNEEMAMERRKIRLTATGILIALVSLTITFCNHNESVNRSKVDRTLELISLANEAHIEVARSQFQNFLLLLSKSHFRIDSSLTKEEQETRKQQIYTDTLIRYQPVAIASTGGDAWSMIRPLGDYYLRVLGCLDAGACDEAIYCHLLADEVSVYSRVTKGYRTRARTQRVYGTRTDEDENKLRCE